MADDGLTRLFLHDLHTRMGARMVGFAGHAMPVQYAAGVMQEHLHTRAAAGLFDVSHMGQVILRPRGTMAALALALERLVPVDVLGLAEGRQRYALFTTPEGGILDDLMVANRGDHLFLVVNASRRAVDLPHLVAGLGDAAEVVPVSGRALLAVQGPAAGAAVAALVPAADPMRFMDVATHGWNGAELWLARSGYTGEDGFEISVPEPVALAFAEALLADPSVAPAGLGARDSLRLEAGLPLYGHDIDATTSPVEAGLAWAIQKVRRPGGDRAGGFPGAARILDELATGAPRRRVGLRPEGRAPMREGTALHRTPDPTEGNPTAPDAPGPDAPGSDATAAGTVTSGGFGPSLGAPLAMGYLPPDIPDGATVWGAVRGRRLPARVVPLPFRPSTPKR